MGEAAESRTLVEKPRVGVDSVPPVEELVERVRRYSPRARVELIERAYARAREAHAGQRRDSGESYFRHPVEVGLILADLELDVVTIAAGLLHDVLEDTPVTYEELEQEFGSEVALIVAGVTKLEKIPFQSREEHQAESLRKMFLAMAEDLRVILIKLADRLHNMRTLGYLSPERRRKVARETLEIYAPIAHRLGMWSIKWEMEDLALRYLHPETYYDIAQRVARRRQEREGDLQEILETLRQKLAEMNLQAEVSGRPKNFYSIYQKMATGRAFEEIYDLIAVRVIVETVRDCYAVLGMVHTLWKPVPGRFKDYIAMPKSNMYQSLHTTVIGPKGDPFEIQIRTREMHQTAERGIAAHWLYKEGYKSSREFEEKVAWLRQVMDWLKEMKDPQEFMETLKIDLFEDEVFVFTPRGDVKTLPAGSTPVDFAFSVHTDIGLHCAGARVNGRIVPLDYPLKNGEFVEILIQKNATPSADWLNFVKTSKARNKVRAWLKEQQREGQVQRGREMLEREIRRLGLPVRETLSAEGLAEVARQYGWTGPEDLLAAVGFGKVTTSQVLNRLLGPEEREQLRHRRAGDTSAAAPRPGRQGTGTSAVRVAGAENVLARLSRCCNPVPGDAIVGYVTRGRGVSVHRADCPNLAGLAQSPERRVLVEWVLGGDSSFAVELQVRAHDRLNLLSDLLSAISDGRTNIESIHSWTSRDRMAIVHVVVDIHSLNHMADVIGRIRRVPGVTDVHRAVPA